MARSGTTWQGFPAPEFPETWQQIRDRLRAEREATPAPPRELRMFWVVDWIDRNTGEVVAHTAFHTEGSPDRSMQSRVGEARRLAARRPPPCLFAHTLPGMDVHMSLRRVGLIEEIQ